MMDSFDYVTFQCRLKALKAEVQAFKSGEKYRQIKLLHQKDIHAYKRKVQKLQAELSRAHSNAIDIRDQWFQIFEDMQKEYDRKLEELRKANRELEKRALKAERQRDEALDKITVLRRQLYETASELEDEKGRNLKLRVQINRDYENSSMPSSKTIKKKKISNSREKSGRKPGGQPGHRGHGRKKQIPTRPVVVLPPPQEVLEDPDFRKTSKTIKKQMVSIRLILDVTEYHADVYYNSKTGERIHASFPPGVVDDVNYAGDIKAFLFLLNNDCCTSIDKCRKFLYDLTEGKLNISKGMISRLSREFAEKSEKEIKRSYADMLKAPVMHTDCTNARVNGKSAYVFICAAPNGDAIYFAREKKGHEGVKGTVAEDYQGILVHDHESTFYNYGSGHQECLAHVLRYLKGSIENEPDREWNKKMRSLVQEMIHYKNGLSDDEKPDADKAKEYERRYREILGKAKEEYEYIPPERYYRDGYNLYRRMEKYMSNHMLFLHDRRVPATNNLAERLLRAYKRKQTQAVSFRSFDSIESLCQCMSMLLMMRKNEETNLFNRVSRIFG